MLFANLLIEWLLAFLRGLWANIASPSALAQKIAWRKLVFVAALLVAAIALAQIVSVDLAFFMAGDIAFYCEIAAAVMFVVVKGHIRQSVYTVTLALSHGLQRARSWCRSMMNARRRRDARHAAMDDKGADEDGGWIVGVMC